MVKKNTRGYKSASLIMCYKSDRTIFVARAYTTGVGFASPAGPAVAGPHLVTAFL